MSPDLRGLRRDFALIYEVLDGTVYINDADDIGAGRLARRRDEHNLIYGVARALRRQGGTVPLNLR
eukprot:10397849-Heterocapsa_arctica.AAC.1